MQEAARIALLQSHDVEIRQRFRKRLERPGSMGIRQEMSPALRQVVAKALRLDLHLDVERQQRQGVWRGSDKASSSEFSHGAGRSSSQRLSQPRIPSQPTARERLAGLFFAGWNAAWRW